MHSAGRRWLPALLLLFLGCDDSPSRSDAGACACEAVTTSFDNASSPLGADNVQDAIDELAARPIPEAPVGSRIETITRTFANSGSAGGITRTAECPMPTRDLALGGGCSVVDTASLVGTAVVNDAASAAYSCSWLQSASSQTMLGVTVVCLRNAR
jgi:hypothetical protein